MADNFYPIGAVLPYAGTLTPASEAQLLTQGFLPCDGRGLPSSNPQYQALQAVLAGAYGSDATNFYLPDYRGRFFRGMSGQAGTDPDASGRTAPRPDLQEPGNTGNTVGSLQAGAVGAHQHDYVVHKDYHRCNYGSLIGPGVYESGKTSSDSSGTSGGTETRPVNAYVYYVMRFR